jgi:hypothetical protein
MAFKITSPFHAIGVPKKSAPQEGSAGRDADDLARKNKTGIYAPPPPRKKVARTKTTAAKINIGEKKGIGEKDVLDSTPKISTKKPTKKTAPKDNSRKAIRQRKKADKAAGVSKSQMRANKAKSKSEAALEKAKKSKNPSYRAQLKRKSDRLAKRAERKGGSPAKVVDPNPKPKPKAKMRTDAEIKKAYPGAVKVKGKINTYKYKGATLNPARFPVEKKGKTVKEAIKLKDKK